MLTRHRVQLRHSRFLSGLPAVDENVYAAIEYVRAVRELYAVAVYTIAQILFPTVFPALCSYFLLAFVYALYYGMRAITYAAFNTSKLWSWSYQYGYGPIVHLERLKQNNKYKFKGEDKESAIQRMERADELTDVMIGWVIVVHILVLVFLRGKMLYHNFWTIDGEDLSRKMRHMRCVALSLG